jgi:hypothetical protein
VTAIAAAKIKNAMGVLLLFQPPDLNLKENIRILETINALVARSSVSTSCVGQIRLKSASDSFKLNFSQAVMASSEAQKIPLAGDGIPLKVVRPASCTLNLARRKAALHTLMKAVYFTQ